MEPLSIVTATFEDLKQHPEVIDYQDENIIIFHTVGLSQMFVDGIAVRLGMAMFSYCEKGCMQVSINDEPHTFQAGELLIYTPNAILSNLMVSPDISIKTVCVSPYFMHNVILPKRSNWKIGRYIKEHPITSIRSKEYTFIEHYNAILASCIDAMERPYNKEILQFLFSAMLCEVMSVLIGQFEKETDAAPEKVSHIDTIFRRFVEMLSKDNGCHRSVAYYANALCYTPKYLSNVVKRISGKTASDLIDEHAIEQIKFRLKHSEKSAKEIAAEFEFSNLSFFGKYVKAHLGVSPLAYRNMKGE